MAQVPLTFKSITCKHCGGIMALIPEGAIIYDTRMRCIHCSVVTLIIKPIDSQQQRVYTNLQPA